MADRHFEPTIPITNEELYEMIKGLTIKELIDAGLGFAKETYTGNDIMLKPDYSISVANIFIGYVATRPPIMIHSIPLDVDLREREVNIAVSRLEKLLKMRLTEVQELDYIRERLEENQGNQ